MFFRTIAAVATVALMGGAAMADDPYEDAAEAWRDYQKEMWKGDYHDAAKEWRKFQRAQSRIYWGAPRYYYPTYSYPVYTYYYSYPAYTPSYRVWTPRTTYYYRSWDRWR